MEEKNSLEKTPEKENEKRLVKENNGNTAANQDKTPEKKENSSYDSTPKKSMSKAESTFKTPDKVLKDHAVDMNVENKTPDHAINKSVDHAGDKSINKTPEHAVKGLENKTPEKTCELKILPKNDTDSFLQTDDEEGMISTTEQARLLIAASKTPSKSINKTPSKQQLTPSGKRSLENSPSTPGKFRRVELITLSSPKTKRIKQI